MTAATVGLEAAEVTAAMPGLPRKRLQPAFLALGIMAVEVLLFMAAAAAVLA
jgi:hypothetical protein